MSTLDAAIGYYRRGWTVVPIHSVEDGLCSCRRLECDSPGKHPRVNWREYQFAPPPETQLMRWWQRWPDSNVGVLTGPGSNLVVVDVDPRHGGNESIRTWPLPITALGLTGGNGEHQLYTYPPGYEHIGIKSVAGVLPGVDIRADGGLVVFPPSIHVSGREYTWDTTYHPDDIPIAELPSFVADAANNVTGGVGAVVEHAVNLDLVAEGKVKVPDGLRNVTMVRIVGRFIDDEDLIRHINATSFDPPLGDHELSRIIESIRKRESRKHATIIEIEETLAAGEPEPEDRLALADRVWHEVGIEVTSDWVVLRGETIEYLLVTPGEEIQLGGNLLDYRELRIRIFNQIGVLLPRLTMKQTHEDRVFTQREWDRLAEILRHLALEQIVEPITAEERVEWWLGEYFMRHAPTSPDVGRVIDSLNAGPIRLGNKIYLRPERLAAFLDTQRIDTVRRVGDVRRVLQQAGWVQERIFDEQRSQKAWMKEEA